MLTMGRTVLGLCVAMLLSATLLASPCVLCFKPPATKSAHDCCKKQEPPKPCGLELSELSTPDIPVAKVAIEGVSPPAAPVVAGDTLAVVATWPAVDLDEPAYTPPPLYLLDTAFLI